MGLDQARTLHRAPGQGAQNLGPTATSPRVPCNSIDRILSTRSLLVNKTPTISVGINEIPLITGFACIFSFIFGRRRGGLDAAEVPSAKLDGDPGLQSPADK